MAVWATSEARLNRPRRCVADGSEMWHATFPNWEGAHWQRRREPTGKGGGSPLGLPERAYAPTLCCMGEG